jgi:phage host-nuclease inhibitor protein Gam
VCSELKGIEADQELEIIAIKKKRQKEIDKLKLVKEDAVSKLEIFANTNPDLFDKKKSIEMNHGKIGFRMNPPKLKLLKSFNWDRVTEKLQNLLPEFVRTKNEPDKEKLLASRDDEKIANHFKAIGVEVVSDEFFYVESKEEELV